MSSTREQELRLPLAHLDRLSSVRVKLPADLRSSDARYAMLKVLREVRVRFPSGVPLLHPLDEMKVSNEQVPKLLRKIETAQAKLADAKLAEAKFGEKWWEHPDLPLSKEHHPGGRGWLCKVVVEGTVRPGDPCRRL